jgi:LmbE family N-acetylglucosaminyl deacetylase
MEQGRSTQECFGARTPVAPIVVAAHPDDETLGMGGQLARWRELTLVHLTDGAPRDLTDARREGFETEHEYAAARRHELDEALNALSEAPVRRLAYECPDQEAILHLKLLTLRLVRDLAGASMVVTHPYEHGHPDHDAAAFVVHAACAMLAREQAKPLILEFPSYHLRGELSIFGRFWPDSSREERVLILTAEERARKSRALSCFVTQRALLQDFPLAVERFRLAPAYDFSRPAPPRAALYDRWEWRITSATWRRYAAAALTDLGLEGAV